jgi:heme exporter protein D
VNMGPHAGFIIAAYAVATIVVMALIVWIIADHRAQRRMLADLEKHGVARRSDRRRRGTV